jgi:NADH-quinone oxidoreductase subunit C
MAMCSIDTIFKNANWLERETSEMYGLLYYWKNDIRKLLLDYSKLENPMLKDFPCEGVQDVFYNFFENQVIVSRVETIEI